MRATDQPILPLMRSRRKVFSVSFRGESNNRACKQRLSHTKWTKICKYQRSVDLSVHGTEQGERIWILKVESTPAGYVWRAFVPSLILPPTGAVSFAPILKTAWNIHRRRHSAALTLPECWHADQQSYAVRILKKWHCVTLEEGRATNATAGSLTRPSRPEQPTWEGNATHKKQIKKMHVAILPAPVKRAKSHSRAADLFGGPDRVENTRNESLAPSQGKGVKSNPIFWG